MVCVWGGGAFASGRGAFKSVGPVSVGYSRIVMLDPALKSMTSLSCTVPARRPEAIVDAVARDLLGNLVHILWHAMTV